MSETFKEGDFVVQREIGTICMKILEIDYDYDEEATSHINGTILNIISDHKNQRLDTSFDENTHKKYFAICEWRDQNNEYHKDNFKFEELAFCPEPFRYKEVEGFSKGENK